MQYLSRSEGKVLRLASMSILLRTWLVLRLPKRGKEKTVPCRVGKATLFVALMSHYYRYVEYLEKKVSLLNSDSKSRSDNQQSPSGNGIEVADEPGRSEHTSSKCHYRPSSRLNLTRLRPHSRLSANLKSLFWISRQMPFSRAW